MIKSIDNIETGHNRPAPLKQNLPEVLEKASHVDHNARIGHVTSPALFSGPHFACITSIQIVLRVFVFSSFDGFLLVLQFEL